MIASVAHRFPLSAMAAPSAPSESEAIPSDVEHVKSRDLKIIDGAFLHGYDHNIIQETVNGEKFRTLTIQCTDNSKHIGPGRTYYSVWTRDLYWGFLGWAQAGDDSVFDMMKSSLTLLIAAKNKNQALGKNKTWPLDDKRFYIPQAYTTGIVIAQDFFPWCSESQADFLLLAHNYWKLTGDRAFIESIFADIAYVTETLELLDTNGNSLPDALQGSYDYQGIGVNTEEPLMSAKASMAFSAVAELARMLGETFRADRLDALAATIKETMNKSVEDGGLWKKDDAGGYYVTRKEGKIEDGFIPYNNLVPIWCGMTSNEQAEAIFSRLDAGFKQYYDLPYGPIYCAPAAGSNKKSVMTSSSVPWLAYLDVYLRGKQKSEANRAEIFNLLMKHAYDAGGIPILEGAGIFGDLTGGAGRAWDNGNFFHMLVSGVYGLEKTDDAIYITDPGRIAGIHFTELKNFCWKKAVYDFKWKGKGNRITRIDVDGKTVSAAADSHKLTGKAGKYEVKIELS